MRADASFLAAVEHLVTHARGLLAGSAEQHYARCEYRSFLFDQAALPHSRFLLGGAGDQIDSFNRDFAGRWGHADNLAGLAFAYFFRTTDEHDHVTALH